MKNNLRYIGVSIKPYVMFKVYKVKRENSIEVPAHMAEKIRDKLSEISYEFEDKLEKEAEPLIKEIEDKIKVLDKQMGDIFDVIGEKSKKQAIKMTSEFIDKHPEYLI